TTPIARRSGERDDVMGRVGAMLAWSPPAFARQSPRSGRRRLRRGVARPFAQATAYRGDFHLPIRVIHIGLGPIGAGVVRQVANRKGFLIVGAVDIDPAKAGKDLGDVCSVGRKLKVKVADDITKAIKATRPDVAVLCTSSSLKKVVPEF